MARKTNSATGAVANQRISLVVTSALYEKISMLADIKTNGNLNALITELIELAAENNAVIIAEGLKARNDYAVLMTQLKNKSDAENPNLIAMQPLTLLDARADLKGGGVVA